MAESARGLGNGGSVADAADAKKPEPFGIPYAEQDFEALWRLVSGCFGDSWSRETLVSTLGTSAIRVWIVRGARGGAAGFLLGRRILDVVEVDLLGVAPDHRRRGIAGQLLDALIGREREQGARTVQLEFRRSNGAARRLYESRGFVVEGERARYYPDGEDALLWTLDLAPGHRKREARLETANSQAAASVPLRGLASVISNEPDGPGRKLMLEMAGWPGSQPGQFVMIGPGAVSGAPRQDPLLPRPMAVYRDGNASDTPDGDRFELLYRIAGRGTTLLAEMAPGDHVSLVGPLGCGFPVTAESGPAILVGGGTGIASLYELARSLRSKGRSVSVLLGARSQADLMAIDDFQALAESGDPGASGSLELVIATEDGSRGHRGLVTLPLAEQLSRMGSQATLFACGPTPMMRAAAELAAAEGARCFVSLENPMACGFGVCLGCAAPRRAGGFALVCREGPVFDALEIDWEGLP